jgi:hypothetical protein
MLILSDVGVGALDQPAPRQQMQTFEIGARSTSQNIRRPQKKSGASATPEHDRRSTDRRCEDPARQCTVYA